MGGETSRSSSRGTVEAGDREGRLLGAAFGSGGEASVRRLRSSPTPSCNASMSLPWDRTHPPTREEVMPSKTRKRLISGSVAVIFPIHFPLIKMSRSGRGRGRGSLTFDIEAIGFARGEVLPEAVFKPPPLYPTTDFRAMPVKTGESEDYLLALKQELRGAMQRSPYFMSKKDEYEGFVPVERYSKKYLQISEEDQKWTPDWRRFPRELKPKKIIKKVGGKAKKPKPAASKVNVDVLKKIEELEKKGGDEKLDEEETEEEKNKKGEEEEEGEEPDEYDEEEHEEDNDYIASYFEDGDDYGVSSEDNLDEATY